MATVNAVSKAASPKIRACYKVGATPCVETTAITRLVEFKEGVADNALAIPSFMSRSAAVITISATDNAEAKSYVMQVTHSTADNGL